MNYSVCCNGNSVEVMRDRVCPPPYNEFSYMEFANVVSNEECIIDIKSEKEISSVKIRPESKKINCSYDLHSISINIDKPCNFIAEINGSCENPLAVFVNPKRDEIPDDVKIIRFSKSEYIGCCRISEDNIAVIIDEGVNITGKLEIADSKGVILAGLGSINERPFTKGECDECFSRCVEIVNCKDVTIYDITVLDSCRWSLSCHNCENVLINNVKIIGSRGNSDGIDICGSRYVTVKNCFTRVWDDSLVVKGFDTGDVHDISFINCVLWNDFARPMEIGVEMRAEKVYNISFSDIDVIHSMTGYPIMGIHHGDRAVIRDVVFENIRVEDAPGAQIFDVRITDSKWNTDTVKGGIENIRFENISFNKNPQFPPENSRLEGYSENAAIKNVTLRNISIDGKTAQTPSALGIDIYDYVENVHVEAQAADSIKEMVEAQICADEFKCRADGLYEGKIKVKIKNIGENTCSTNVGLKVSPINSALFEAHHIELKAGEVQILEENAVLQPGKYAFTLESDSHIVLKSPLLLKLSWILSINENSGLDFYDFYGENYGKLKACRSENGIKFSGITEFYDLTVYTANLYKEEEGTVAFSCEETDFGMAPALIKRKDGYVSAPQLRCPAEITMVFKNQPKTDKLIKNFIKRGQKCFELTFEDMGIDPDAKGFLIEIVLTDSLLPKRRYPLSLFHSQQPEKLVHMFAEVKLSGKNS